MRIGHDELVFRALVALVDAAERCGDAPLEPTGALRFALLIAWAAGTGHREPFDEFWRAVRDPVSHAHHPSAARTYRQNYARRALEGIKRALGVPPLVEVDIALRAGARGDRAAFDLYRSHLAESRGKLKTHPK